MPAARYRLQDGAAEAFVKEELAMRETMSAQARPMDETFAQPLAQSEQVSGGRADHHAHEQIGHEMYCVSDEGSSLLWFIVLFALRR